MKSSISYQLSVMSLFFSNGLQKISLRLCFSAAILFSFFLLPFAFAKAQGLPLAAPQTVGMSAEKLNQIDALVAKDIADKKLPGAVVLIGRKGKIVFRRAYGNRSLAPKIEK